MANVHSKAKLRPRHTPAKPQIRQSKNLAARTKVAPHNPPAGAQREPHRPIHLSASLRTFLTSERDLLIKAEAVLLCSSTAMESNHPLTGPYYPDVIELAANLIRRQVVHLDDLLTDGTLPPAER